MITLKPVKTMRASEAIYDQIVDLIVTEELKPGERLPPERTLAEMLGRSRPIIREALRMLETAGFISITPGANGAVVQGITTTSVEQSLGSMFQYNKITLKDIFEYRMITGVAVVEWASLRRTDEELKLLEDNLVESMELLDNYPEFVKNDIMFHSILSKAAKNELACIMAKVMRRMLSNYLEDYMKSKTPEERKENCITIHDMHQKIFDAIKAKDPVTARECMISHLNAFKEDLE